MTVEKKIAIAKKILKTMQEKHGGALALALKYYSSRLLPSEEKSFLWALNTLPTDFYATF